MYVENNKLSSRQIFRLYVFDLMGIATLLLPPYLSKLCGIDGVFAIVIGTVVALIYLLYLGWILKQMQTDAGTYLKKQTKVRFQKLVYLLVLLHCIVTAGFCAYVFSNVMQYSLVQESSYEIILFVILFVAGLAAYEILIYIYYSSKYHEQQQAL